MRPSGRSHGSQKEGKLMGRRQNTVQGSSRASQKAETSFEVLASGSNHPQHLSVQHIQPWEKRSCLWYALPLRGHHMNVAGGVIPG